MYANWSDFNWNNNLQRQLIAFLLSALLVLLLLFIPVKLHFDSLIQSTSLEVELSHTISPKQVAIEPVSKNRPKPELKPELDSNRLSGSQPKVIKPKTIKTLPKRKNPPKVIIENPLPSSAVILNTYRNRNDYKEINQDFKAPTDHEQDFQFKTIKSSKIFQVSKYLNEEIDKPQVQMDYKVDNSFVSTVKFLQTLTGGVYDDSEKQYIDCDLAEEGIPDWQCK